MTPAGSGAVNVADFPSSSFESPSLDFVANTLTTDSDKLTIAVREGSDIPSNGSFFDGVSDRVCTFTSSNIQHAGLGIQIYTSRIQTPLVLSPRKAVLSAGNLKRDWVFYS